MGRTSVGQAEQSTGKNLSNGNQKTKTSISKMTLARAESAIEAVKKKNEESYEQQSDSSVNGSSSTASSSSDGMQNVRVEPDEPAENNPSLADLKKKSQNISRMTDKGMINEVAGSSVTIRDSGQINLSASKTAQYKLNPKGASIEYSMESTTVTNRKRLYTDEVVINDHKLNPRIYELTDFKKLSLPTNQEALVGNFCVYGSVLVKAWEANLKRYVMIRRPCRMPLFSPLMNLPKIMPELGIADPLEYEEDVYAYDTEKGYQVNGVISDAKSLIDIKNAKILEGKDRPGIDRNFKMTISGSDASLAGSGSGNVVNSGSLGGGNVDPKIVYKYLIGKGYNDIAAAGIMGNIQQESGFNTGALSYDGMGSIGLCQWTNERLTNLKSLASSTNRDFKDAGAQLDFLWKELQEYASLLPAQFNNCGSPGDAAEKFERVFERASVPEMQNRISAANGFYAKMQSGEYKN